MRIFRQPSKIIKINKVPILYKGYYYYGKAGSNRDLSIGRKSKNSNTFIIRPPKRHKDDFVDKFIKGNIFEMYYTTNSDKTSIIKGRIDYVYHTDNRRRFDVQIFPFYDNDDNTFTPVILEIKNNENL